MTRNPARSNMARVPTNAIVLSMRPAGSTGRASLTAAHHDADDAPHLDLVHGADELGCGK
ncbi:hypothetical protein [Arthrobacter sp. MYb227]|uniref:hypothetical protein n=1 Tax=Arthrobacter sp. MYb227 TaxID=1848601 RepID=UPI0015E28478|nr:hypothetical protein [Arthrobacter sp. MYb227]